WNEGTEQEIYTKEELIQKFSMERVHSAGAKFDYEKAKWFNHEWLKRLEVGSLKLEVKTLLTEKGITVTDDSVLEKVIGLVKDRCQLLTDFVQQSDYFFKAPETIDTAAVKPKWNEAKQLFFAELIRNYELATDWEAHTLENNLKEIAAVNDLKPGELMLPLRIMLVGGKFGPGVFDIAAILGKAETIKRMETALALLQ
ncbi:MAG TPA: glutamate--tRNA ligase, partial [Chitinophagaceae bacterium]|nr:glutamate--tRNA ligase [Chitinophagaceae bacterium]